MLLMLYTQKDEKKIQKPAEMNKLCTNKCTHTHTQPHSHIFNFYMGPRMMPVQMHILRYASYIFRLILLPLLSLHLFFTFSVALSVALEMETSIRMGMGVYGKPIYGLQSLKQLDAIHIFTHIYKMIMIKVKETSVTFANELWGRKLASPDSSNG